jgi:hypothetical protein
MLPSLICDPTIVKDPERILAIVSLTNLKELQRKFLSNHVEAATRQCILHGFCPIFQLLQKISLSSGQDFLANQIEILGSRHRDRAYNCLNF